MDPCQVKTSTSPDSPAAQQHFTMCPRLMGKKSLIVVNWALTGVKSNGVLLK